MSPTELEALLHVVRSEYAEMPGLRLTLSQAQRLWNLDRATCERMFAALVDRGILYRGRDSTYAWTGSDTPHRPRRVTRQPAISAVPACW